MEFFDEFLGAGLPCGSPGLCGLPADLVLDLIEPADAQQSLGRDRRVATLGDVVEAASEMAPAQREHERTAFTLRTGERVIRNIAVDLQGAAEPGEILPGRRLQRPGAPHADTRLGGELAHRGGAAGRVRPSRGAGREVGRAQATAFVGREGSWSYRVGSCRRADGPPPQHGQTLFSGSN